jgi:hypothetical protein
MKVAMRRMVDNGVNSVKEEKIKEEGKDAACVKMYRERKVRVRGVEENL